MLFFKTPFTTNEALYELRDAVDKGIIGEYSVKTLRIVQDKDPTTSPKSTSTAVVSSWEKTTLFTPGGICVV